MARWPRPPTPKTATRSPEVAAAEPADADAVASVPGAYTCADRVDLARDLVARSAREVVAHRARHRQCVRVADAAGVDLDANLAGARLRNFDVDELKPPVGLRDADNLHGFHTRDHSRLLAWES